MSAEQDELPPLELEPETPETPEEQKGKKKRGGNGNENQNPEVVEKISFAQTVMKIHPQDKNDIYASAQGLLAQGTNVDTFLYLLADQIEKAINKLV